MDTAESDLQSAEIKLFIDSMPASRLLGIEIVSLGLGRSVLSMPINPEVTFDGRDVQGGIVGVMADYAAVAAAASTLEVGWRVATLSCETHNLRPARGDRLIAQGEIIKGGRRHLVARADVSINEPDGTLCLTGLFTASPIAPA